MNLFSENSKRCFRLVVQRLLNLKNWLYFIIVTAVFWDLPLPFPRYYRILVTVPTVLP